jgi:hypothetical protein
MTRTPEQLDTDNTKPLSAEDILELVTLAEQDIADLLSKTTDTDPVVSKKAALAVYEINSEVLAALYDFATSVGINLHADSEHGMGAKAALYDLISGYRETSKKNPTETSERAVIRPEMLEDTTKSLPSIVLAIAQGSVIKPLNPADAVLLKDGYARQIKGSLGLLKQGALLQEEQGEVVATTPAFADHIRNITTILDASHTDAN